MQNSQDYLDFPTVLTSVHISTHRFMDQSNYSRRICASIFAKHANIVPFSSRSRIRPYLHTRLLGQQHSLTSHPRLFLCAMRQFLRISSRSQICTYLHTPLLGWEHLLALHPCRTLCPNRKIHFIFLLSFRLKLITIPDSFIPTLPFWATFLQRHLHPQQLLFWNLRYPLLVQNRHLLQLLLFARFRSAYFSVLLISVVVIRLQVSPTPKESTLLNQNTWGSKTSITLLVIEANFANYPCLCVSSRNILEVNSFPVLPQLRFDFSFTLVAEPFFNHLISLDDVDIIKKSPIEN